jgi:hypothetical protein
MGGTFCRFYHLTGPGSWHGRPRRNFERLVERSCLGHGSFFLESDVRTADSLLSFYLFIFLSFYLAFAILLLQKDGLKPLCA